MCHNDLSQTDIKAIGKNRGFKPHEFATPTALESIYLSHVGLKQVMATLSTAEAAMLHFLVTMDSPVSVDWFERLYNPTFKSNYYTRTFTQRYQSVFKEVQTQLVRKGILIMAQIPLPEATKMEQWHFVLPPEFVPYLPSPVGEMKRLTTPGETQRDVPRNKVLALTGKATPPSPELPKHKLALQNGRLLLGEQPFTAAGLQEWQQVSWQIRMPEGTQLGERPLSKSTTYQSTPLETLNYAFNLLQPDEWLAAKQVDEILKIFCLRSFDAKDLCELGWKWGYLAKNGVEGKSYYRLASTATADEKPLAPATYLSALDKETVRVDLHTIPYAALEQLNKVAYLKIEAGELTAVPDLIQMGSAPQANLDSPLMTWLTTHIPAFAEAQKTIAARWGKQIVHTNLHIARVKDLALRVKLERELTDQECVILSDEYIAFPPKALSKVKRIVDQLGHVIKNHA